MSFAGIGKVASTFHNYMAGMTTMLTLGNHDAHSGKPPARLAAQASQPWKEVRAWAIMWFKSSMSLKLNSHSTLGGFALD